MADDPVVAGLRRAAAGAERCPDSELSVRLYRYALPRRQPPSRSAGRTCDLDGRRRRGVASRRAILDAASGLIAEVGVGALTHRASPRRRPAPPRVPTTPEVDDLMQAAARRYLQTSTPPAATAERR